VNFAAPFPFSDADYRATFRAATLASGRSQPTPLCPPGDFAAESTGRERAQSECRVIRRRL
jgi:hypothetical protein